MVKHVLKQIEMLKLDSYVSFLKQYEDKAGLLLRIAIATIFGLTGLFKLITLIRLGGNSAGAYSILGPLAIVVFLIVMILEIGFAALILSGTNVRFSAFALAIMMILGFVFIDLPGLVTLSAQPFHLGLFLVCISLALFSK